jgi:hypothetical protein
MLTPHEQSLLNTLRAYADPEATVLEDHKGSGLHVEVNFGSGRRDVMFDHVSKRDLGRLADQQRGDVVARLFENAITWPDGRLEVKCLSDVLQTPSMVAHADFQVFIGDAAVGQGIRISTQMTPKP